MRTAFAIFLLCAVAACAPTLKPMGPVTTQPRLQADALIAADGARLPLQSWMPAGRPKAVILGVHGFNDYANTFAAPGAWFAKQGIATYAYDQRGFGRAPARGFWAGTATMTADLRAAARAVRARHPDTPLYLLGNSMGGAVVLAALADGPIEDVAGAALTAPAVWGRAHMNPFQVAALWISARTVPWFTVTGRGLNRQPSDNIPMLRRLGRDPLVIKATRIDTIEGLVDLMDTAYEEATQGAPRMKLLVMYGTRDEIVPEDPVIAAMRALVRHPGQRAALYATGWHMLLRDIKAEIVWRDIAAWIADPSGQLPSGAEAKAAKVLRVGKPATAAR